MSKEEKQVKKVQVDHYLDWTCGVTIEKLRKDLDILEGLNVSEILINEDWDGDIQIVAYTTRLETDIEYEKRVKEERLRKEALELRELQQLEKLKKKYESKL